MVEECDGHVWTLRWDGQNGVTKDVLVIYLYNDAVT